MGETELVPIRNTEASVALFMPLLSMSQALQRRQIIVDTTHQLMKEGVDYGKVPGCERDTLLQPGADKLCNLFGLVIRYEPLEQIEDWTGDQHGGEPFFYYRFRGTAFKGDVVMGEGIGSCNSWEAKYRWRTQERTCPTCGKATIFKSKQEPGWFCWVKKGGCGAKFPPGDQTIEGQEVGRKLNPDVFDVVNTVQKMALKRTKVATAINATSASEFFTQDMEDFDTGGNGGSREAQRETAERRIAEERAKVEVFPNVVPAPAVTPEVIPPEIERLWNRLTKLDGVFHVFEELKAGVTETTGSDAPYYEILGRHGMKHASDVKGMKRGAVKACVRELYEYLAKTRAALAPPPYEATEDDVPPELGGAA